MIHIGSFFDMQIPLHTTQVTQEPTVVPENWTQMLLMYESDSIEVQKEEEAYSFLSMVADCGGLLGLFIGFNFLMIWDGMIFSLTSLNHMLNSKSNRKQF